MPPMLRALLVVLVVSVFSSCIAEAEKVIVQRIRTTPLRKLESVVIDGMGRMAGLHSSEGSFQGFDEMTIGNTSVSVSIVAWLTLAMAAATGLGSIPFFFVDLEPQYAGVCNGLAAGVIIAASFDLIQEGQDNGSGNWVVFGILAGGFFIWLCKKQCGEWSEQKGLCRLMWKDARCNNGRELAPKSEPEF